MNLIKFFFIFLFFPLAAFSQQDKDLRSKDVPQAVKDSLNAKYGSVSKLKYYKELFKDKVLYEASFEYQSDKYEVTFYEDGKVNEIEMELRIDQLADNVKSTIMKDLSGRFTKFKIRTIEVVNPETDKIYELALHASKAKHSGYYEVYYDKNGSFIREEEKVLRSIPSNSGF